MALTVAMAMPANAQKQFKVGVAVGLFEHPVLQAMMNGFRAEAEKQGIELIMVDGRNDPAVQTSQLEGFIAQQVDGIILNAAIADPMLPAIKEVNKAGIPLVVVDRKIYKKGQDVTWNATVAWDIPLSGTIAGAETVAALKGHGNVVALEGDPATSVFSDRGDAFYKIIDQFPGIEVIYKAPGMFRRDTGLKVTQDFLAKYPKGTIDALYSMNDEMTLGALEAIKAAGRLGEFKIISTDGDPASMEALRKGEIDYNVIFHPEEQAAAVTVMAKILRGESIDGPVAYGGKDFGLLDFEGLPWFRPTCYWVDQSNASDPNLKSSW